MKNTRNLNYLSKLNLLKNIFNNYINQTTIENNSIILEASIIPINQVREIKLPYLRLKSAFKGFAKGGLTCVGLTLGGMVVIAGGSSAELLSGEALLFAMVTTPFAALIGGGVNAIRHYVKAESSYKIDQDNWKIIAGK